MNNRHLIDQAVFDTTYRGVLPRDEQPAEVDEFIKSSLVAVIDETFERIDAEFRQRTETLRLHRLEIDLGEIDLRHYRQQLPRKLRQRIRTKIENRQSSDPRSVARDDALTIRAAWNL